MTDTSITEEADEIVVLCLPRQSAWSVLAEAKAAAKAEGRTINLAIPPTVMRSGTISGVDLAAKGLKAVVYTMKGSA